MRSVQLHINVIRKVLEGVVVSMKEKAHHEFPASREKEKHKIKLQIQPTTKNVYIYKRDI